MADETVTIRAELIDDVTAGAAAVKAQMDALAASVSKLDVAGTKFSGSATKVTKSMKDLNDMGKKAGEAINDFTDKIGSKLADAAEKGAKGLAVLALGAVAIGVKFTMSMQQSQMALTTFFGSASTAASVMAQLKPLIGPVSLGALTQGVTTMETSGMDPGKVMDLTKSMVNIATQANPGNPGSVFDTLSTAVNRIFQTQMLEPRALMGMMQNGVDVYGMLSQELGIPRDRVKQMLMEMNRSGGSMTAPSTFLTDLAAQGSTGKFQGGINKWFATLPGEIAKAKVSFQELTSALSQPLADFLSKEGPKFTQWTTDVTTRFKELGGLLGQEWSSGNTKGFAATLGTILGDPQLAGIIQPIASGIQSLATIFVHDFIPMAKDLMSVAVPALQALSGVLSFLSGQPAAVTALVVAFGGFLALVKVGSILVSIAEGLTALKTAGMIGGSGSFLSGLFGAGVPGAGAAAAGGAGGMGLAGTLGAGALGLFGGYEAYQGLKSKKSGISDLQLVGGSTLTGAMIGSIVPVIGTAVGAAAGAAIGGGLDIAKHLFGSGGHKTAAAPGSMTFHPGSIVVQMNPGPNAQATGQAVGQSIADQIFNYQRQVAERGGPNV